MIKFDATNVPAWMKRHPHLARCWALILVSLFPILLVAKILWHTLSEEWRSFLDEWKEVVKAAFGKWENLSEQNKTKG